MFFMNADTDKKYNELKEKINNKLDIYRMNEMSPESFLENTWILLFEMTTINGKVVKEKYIELMRNYLAFLSKYFENVDEIEKFYDDKPSPIKLVCDHESNLLDCDDCRGIYLFESIDRSITQEAKMILMLKFQLSALDELKKRENVDQEELNKGKLMFVELAAQTFGGLLLTSKLFGINVEEFI